MSSSPAPVWRDVDELRTLIVFTCAEYIGTLFVTMFACGSLISAGTLTYQFSMEELSAGRLLAYALSNGLAYGAVLYTMLCIGNSYSKSKVVRKRRDVSHYTMRYPVGHCNPAVTFAVCVVGDISAILAMMYFVAQLAGAISGAFFVWFVLPNADETQLATTLPGSGADDYQVFGMEMLTTFSLVMVLLHFFVMDTDKILNNSNSHFRTGPKTFNHMAPFAAGMAVTALTLLGAQVSGASMNPARSFASALVSETWEKHWIYWAGPMSASLIAAILSSPFIVYLHKL